MTTRHPNPTTPPVARRPTSSRRPTSGRRPTTTAARRPPVAALTGAAIVLPVLLVGLLAGCGVQDPYRAPAATPGPSGPRVVHNEVRAARPAASDPRPALTNPAATPQVAIERFARLYVNWTYRTLAANRRRLAAMAVGEAAASERRAARQTASDYELREGRVRNTGRLIATAPVRGNHAHRYVVITRERTQGGDRYADLPAAYHLTLATLTRVPHGWAVRQWDPQT